MNDGDGRSTYDKLLASLRASGSPIGTQHNMHDKQFKEWCKGKSPEEIASKVKKTDKDKNNVQPSGAIRKISKEEAQKILEKVNKAKTNTENVKKFGSVKVIESAEAKGKRLLEMYHKMKMQKLADAYKSDGRLDHIKSVGNGL